MLETGGAAWEHGHVALWVAGVANLREEASNLVVLFQSPEMFFLFFCFFPAGAESGRHQGEGAGAFAPCAKCVAGRRQGWGGP